MDEYDFTEDDEVVVDGALAELEHVTVAHNATGREMVINRYLAESRVEKKHAQAAHERSMQKLVIGATLFMFGLLIVFYAVLALVHSDSSELLELIKWVSPLFAGYWGFYLGAGKNANFED